MPDLTEHGVTTWFADLRPDLSPEWPPALRAVERTADVYDSLVVLGALLDEIAEHDPGAVAVVLRNTTVLAELTTVLAQCGAARALRVLHWIAELNLPGGTQIIGAVLRTDTPAGAALQATVSATTRHATLQRIYGNERVLALVEACGDAFSETT